MERVDLFSRIFEAFGPGWILLMLACVIGALLTLDEMDQLINKENPHDTDADSDFNE